MVFSSSIPSYQDPHNWHVQQPGGDHQISDNNQIPVLSQPPPPANGTGIGSVRTGSIAERARVAKLPQPEAALKCPRCDSTNTKFCYFNNYNLSQPRHFCKTCRRYWTRGGALRNVPVGGGCRRNKRSKGISRSKSPAITTDHRQAAHAVTSSNNCSSSHDMILGHLLPPPQQLPLLHPSLPNISSTGDIGLNFTGFQPSVAAAGTGGTNIMGYQLGLNSSAAAAAAAADHHHHQYWRLQQFPFLTGLEPASSGILYPFEGEGEGEGVDLSGYSGAAANGDQLVSKPILDSGVIGQMATAVKIEDNQGLNLSRNFLGNGSTDQYWGTGGGSGASSAWNTSDLSGFTCSSTSHLL